MDLVTNKTLDSLNIKLYKDTDYRKFVSWKLMMIGLGIAYERYSSVQGLDKAYNFLIRHAPEFKGRFMTKAFHENIIEKRDPKQCQILALTKGDFKTHHNWIEKGHKNIERPKAIRVCQVIGMDIWGICSPQDSVGDLEKPYRHYENLLLSIIIP